MKDIVDLCKAKVIWAKGSAFILLRLCRNSRELCGVSETNLKDGDFLLCPSRSCELKGRGQVLVSGWDTLFSKSLVASGNPQ